MKSIYILIALIVGDLSQAKEKDLIPTPIEKLTNLNKEGSVNVVFWMKPYITNYATKNPLHEYYSPEWKVSIKNQSGEDLVIDKIWFTSAKWLNMVEIKNGVNTGRVVSHSEKVSELIIIKKDETIDLDIELEHFPIARVGGDLKYNIQYPIAGEFIITHDIFLSAELRISVTSKGEISILHPSMYPHYRHKIDNSAQQAAPRNR